MGGKVDIIIPAYNAVATLNRAAESVLAQSLRDVVLWIVDDGSGDGTAEVADRLARLDSRVRVIHQQNQGAFRARLAALSQASSEYFAFVDADDWIDPTYCEQMYRFATDQKIDVVQASVEMPVGVVRGRDEVRQQIVLPWLFGGEGSALVWDKLYARKCAEVAFDAGYRASLFEDMVMNLYFFRNAASFGRARITGYHYCPASSSSTRHYRAGYIDDFRAAIRLRQELLETYGMRVPRCVMDEWTLKNGYNLAMMVLNTASMSLGAALGSVREVISLDELGNAANSRITDERARNMKRLMKHPTAFVLRHCLKRNIGVFARKVLGRGK